MNNKLKLPLAAVFSFLLGGVVFFPWSSDDGIPTPVKASSKTVSIFDKVTVTANIKKIEYHFSDNDLKYSNLAIKEQLNSFNSAKNLAQVTSVPKKSDTEKDVITKFNIKKIIHQFPANELQDSNLAIQKQLGRYIASNDEQKTQSTKNSRIDEIEVAEKPESERLVEDAPDNFNDEDEFDQIELRKQKFKNIKYKKISFIESEVKKSNLIISKQLRGYDDDSLEADETNVEKSDNSNSKLEVTKSKVKKITKKTSKISSNEPYQGKQFRKSNLSSVNTNYLQDDTNEQEENDEDEDEYGSERVVFKKNPHYFTDSFEKESNSETTPSTTEPEIEVIDIGDDGKVVTSVANKF